MSRSGFKRFEFFDVDTLSADVTTTLGSMPTCAIAEGGMLLFGDKNGFLIMCERTFQSAEKKHKLFRGEVKGIAYLYDPYNVAKQFVIVLGDDAQPQYGESTTEKYQPLYFVKIYSTSDFLRPLHVLNATVNDALATSFAVLPDGQQIAVGYDSGAVIVFSGKYLQDASSTAVRNAAYTTVLTSHAYPVTSLYFCETISKRNSNERRIRLFAVMDVPDAPLTDLSQDRAGEQGTVFTRPPDPGINGEDPKYAGVLIFDTSLVTGAGTDLSGPPKHTVRVLDERGAPARCAALMRGQSELVVARNEAVYNYSVEDKGGALAIPGDKLCICAVGRYTLVVSVEERTAVPVVAAGISATDGELPTYLKPKRPAVNIYDLRNKIICGTSKKYLLPLSEKVLFTMSDGGVVYLITTSGQMIRFREKDTHRKLDVLLTQSNPPLYSLAIMLAAEEQLEPAEIMKLYKQYGDHLYEQKDFDGSIAQYSHTIGYIPSSSIITKFLDPYRIANLIAYLEKLHAKGLAASDHVTLLLSCYTKIKDEAQINALLDAITQNPHIKSGGATSKVQMLKNTQVGVDEVGNVAQFHPEQAIAILNTAGYTAHALKLAARYHQHGAYLDILMKKSPPAYDEVLGYLAYLPFVSPVEDVLNLLKVHGRTLSRHRAAVLSALLIKLCIGDYAALLPSNHPVLKAAKADGSAGGGSKQVKDNSGGQTKAKTTVSEVLKSFTHLVAADVVLPTERLPVTEVMYLFTSDAVGLLNLLEGFVEGSPGRILPSKVITTLAELYMQKYQRQNAQLSELRAQKATTAAAIKEAEAALQTLETQIMALLDGAHAQYDPAHALLLCHATGFERGQRFLLERQQCTDLLMRMLMEGHETKEVFKVLRREGTKDPNLYIQVLTYFVQQSIVPGEGVEEGKRAGVRRQSSGSGGSADDSGSEDEAESVDDEDRWNAIIDIMDMIEKEAVLAPLQVLSILALNPRLPLHVAANYMSSTLKGLADSTESVKGAVQSAMTDIESVTASLSNSNQPTARQLRQQERAQRRQQQRAAANVHRIGVGANVKPQNLQEEEYDEEEEEDEETEEQERLQKAKRDEYWHNLRSAMLECSSNHEAFFKKLAHNPDGFGVVVEHFGRSIVS